MGTKYEPLAVDPIEWLQDPEYDRLRWAIARARGRPGGSTHEDEALADEILERLREMSGAVPRALEPEEDIDAVRRLLPYI